MKTFEENKWYWASNPAEGDIFLAIHFLNGKLHINGKTYSEIDVTGMDIVEAVMPINTMPVFHCKKVFNGFGLEAVVTAKNRESALKLLDWETGYDPDSGSETTEIWTTYIGAANVDEEKIWCQEAL